MYAASALIAKLVGTSAHSDSSSVVPAYASAPAPAPALTTRPPHQQLQTPLPPRVDFSSIGGFPYTTLNKRMPEILTRVIDDVHVRVAALMPTDKSEGNALAVAEWKAALAVVNQLVRLKRQMQTNKPLTDVDLPDAYCTAAWNAALHTYDAPDGAMVSWYSGPWLLVECYMYCRIQQALLSSRLLASHDPFRVQKQSSFSASHRPVLALAELVIEASLSLSLA
jgi:hypothetical protein